ncbi:MAG: MEDS domain-containing protein, partial [Thermodesulfobacteriota bacterium]
MPWGTHCCLFYHNIDELAELVISYFIAGLENNECCIWLTPATLSTETAIGWFEDHGIDARHYLSTGQLTIEDTRHHYLQSGRFDTEELLQKWLTWSDWAKQQNYDGIRISGDAFWAGSPDRQDFYDYEMAIDQALSETPILALCLYPTEHTDPYDISIASNSHEYSLIRHDKQWRVIENLGRRRAETQLDQNRDVFSSIVDHNPDAILVTDRDLRIRFANPTARLIFNISGSNGLGGRLPIPFDKDELTNVHL